MGGVFGLDLADLVLLAILAMVPLSAIVTFLLARRETAVMLRRLDGLGSVENEFREALPRIETLSKAEEDNGRLIAGIIENLLPALQHLNTDLLELGRRVDELGKSDGKRHEAAAALQAKLEGCEERLTRAVSDVTSLLEINQATVAEQRDRLKAIELGLYAIGNRRTKVKNAEPSDQHEDPEKTLVSGLAPGAVEASPTAKPARLLPVAAEGAIEHEESWRRGA